MIYVSDINLNWTEDGTYNRTEWERRTFDTREERDSYMRQVLDRLYPGAWRLEEPGRARIQHTPSMGNLVLAHGSHQPNDLSGLANLPMMDMTAITVNPMFTMALPDFAEPMMVGGGLQQSVTPVQTKPAVIRDANITVGGKPFKLGEKITWSSPPKDELTETGRELLYEALTAWLIPLMVFPGSFDADRKRWRVRQIAANLPTHWAWSWTVQKGDYRGTLPNRIEQWFYKRYAYVMPKDFKAKLGSICKDNMAPATRQYVFDIVQHFDWDMGDFADDDSCYWGSHKFAKTMLRDNGVYALRYYDPAQPRTGIGRSWLTNHVPDESSFILWNGYDGGGHDNTSTMSFAKMMAEYTGLPYKKITLSNNGTPHDELYINGDGHGYLLAPAETIKTHTSYDFGWTKREGLCQDCGTLKASHELHFGAHHRAYCAACWPNQYELYCEGCEQIVHRDYSHEVDGYTYCDECFEERYFECDECHNAVGLYMKNEVDGDELCPNCFSEHYGHCSVCRTTHDQDELTLFDNDHLYICQACIKIAAHCPDCDEIITDGTSYAFGGKLYCYACMDKRRHRIAFPTR